MPITDSGKNWQKKNSEKTREYSRAYRAKKTQVTLYLDSWVIEEIIAAKEEGTSNASWVKQQIEDWAKQRRLSKTALPPSSVSTNVEIQE
ncbi:hypothetical protein [Scytonema sp. PCC 10023]|uniref:hypothetical protein n=1 Tax=Scytonema sp. PCC 10023 TaxID=1680591 RepID=UPI0039C75CC5